MIGEVCEGCNSSYLARGTLCDPAFLFIPTQKSLWELCFRHPEVTTAPIFCLSNFLLGAGAGCVCVFDRYYCLGYGRLDWSRLCVVLYLEMYHLFSKFWMSLGLLGAYLNGYGNSTAAVRTEVRMICTYGCTKT